MNWYRLLLTFLWISPHLLIAIVVILIYRRRIYRQVSFFSLYALYEIGAFVLLYGLDSIPSVTASQYTYAFMATLAISVALRFGVIKEVAEDLFRDHPVLESAATRSL